MFSSRACSSLALGVFITGLAVTEAACTSAPAEQVLLNNFFRAARVRDNTTLGNIAAVNFNPRTEGTVENFEVAAVGPEQRQPVQLRVLMDERGLAVSSLTPPGRPDVDVSNMNVELVTKEVTVDAQVRTPEGQTVPRTIVFTFTRAVANEGGQAREGRWLITALRQQAARPSS